MILRTSLRGQPLSVLVLILGGWVALRVATWAPPAWDMTVRDGWAIPAPAMPALADKTAGAADGRMVAEGFARGPISPPYGMGYPEGMALSGFPAPSPGWQMGGAYRNRFSSRCVFPCRSIIILRRRGVVRLVRRHLPWRAMGPVR